MLYIIDRHTGTTKVAENPGDYAINNDVTLLATSTFQSLASVNTGDIVYLDDCKYFGIVTAVGYRQFDTVPLYSMLNRKIVKPTETLSGYTQELKRIIDANLISSADTFLNYPITTDNIYPYASEQYFYKADSDGMVNILDVYLEMFSQARTAITFEMTATGAKMVIGNTALLTTKVIDLSTMNITSEEMQSDFVSKVIAKNTVTGNTTTYYAYTDGTVSTTSNMSGKTRVYGRTEYTFAATTEETAQSATTLLKENALNHLIEFEAPGEIFGQTLELYDPVKIKGRNGVVYTSYISAVSKTKNSRLIKYKTGNLRVTLTDKMRRLVK